MLRFSSLSFLFDFFHCASAVIGRGSSVQSDFGRYLFFFLRFFSKMFKCNLQNTIFQLLKSLLQFLGSILIEIVIQGDWIERKKEWRIADNFEGGGPFLFFHSRSGSVKGSLKWPDPWHVLIPAERIRFRNVRRLCSSNLRTIPFLNASTCWPIYQPLPKDPISPTFRGLCWPSKVLESSSIATSGILPGPFAVSPDIWIFFPQSFLSFNIPALKTD